MTQVPSSSDQNSGAPFLVISRHDLRSPRHVSIHFIAKQLSKRGKTRFFSFGFSRLSRLKGDPRLELWDRANRMEVEDGVECYLWRTPIHAVSLRKAQFNFLEAILFRIYRNLIPPIFRQWIKESRTIVFESGFPVIFIRICKALNPDARLLYVANDSLKTIECAEFIISEFNELAPMMDGIALPSRWLQRETPPASRMYFVPHGIDVSIADHADPSPYSSGGINAVCVGSMLFDAEFFKIAAAAFPKINFYIMGGGPRSLTLSAPNLRIMPEVPFLQTLPYIKHANFGIAPYDERASPFLIDTSMKLLQYGFFGVPAVCPQMVAGNYPTRFGYDRTSAASISEAIWAALAHGNFSGETALSWSDVIDRLLEPEKFDDTRILDVV